MLSDKAVQTWLLPLIVTSRRGWWCTAFTPVNSDIPSDTVKIPTFHFRVISKTKWVCVGLRQEFIVVQGLPGRGAGLSLGVRKSRQISGLEVTLRVVSQGKGQESVLGHATGTYFCFSEGER